MNNKVLEIGKPYITECNDGNSARLNFDLLESGKVIYTAWYEVTLSDRIFGYGVLIYRIIRRKVYRTDFGKKLYKKQVITSVKQGFAGSKKLSL